MATSKSNELKEDFNLFDWKLAKSKYWVIITSILFVLKVHQTQL